MGASMKTNKKAFSFVANTKKPKKGNNSTAQGRRNSSRKSNGYSKKSHSFSMTKKFKGLQKIFIKDPAAKLRHNNQTPNNQISAMMSIPATGSMKNNNNSMIANKNILHHASCRRKPIKSSKLDTHQYYEQDKDKFWQWDMLANTSSSRGKRSSILDLSGIIPVSGNRTTLLKKNSVNVPNYRSSSKNKFCMSNRANLREMRTSEQNSATANYVKANPLSFHIQNDKNDSRCCISAIGMHTHYLNNSIGDSEELVENTNRSTVKKKKTAQITQKYNSGRFQYSSQEGNPNYSSLSNSDLPDEKISNRQRNRGSTISYHQQRKGKSKTSKGYYKSTGDKHEFKSNSKSKKRKISKRNRSSKNHENAQTPMSMTKYAKTNTKEFTAECDSIAKRKRRKVQNVDSAKHHKNASDNSIMYTSHSCGPNIHELIDPKIAKQANAGLQPSYSPYVSNNTNNRKASQRSKSTNPHVSSNPHNPMDCSEGFVNIDLSQLPHDMTQREVVETMIRKHEISNFMYSDEDEDTSRYIMQNPDDRRTCRRSQYNNKKPSPSKDSTSPIDFHKKILLGSKSSSLALKSVTNEAEPPTSKTEKGINKSNIITDEVVGKLMQSMSSNLECLQNYDKNKGSNTNGQAEKKFFLYCNILEELTTHYPKLKDLLITLKEGFQATIRNIVANKIKEKGIRDSNKINEERENLHKIQKQFDDRGVIIEEQEDIIESKDDMIQQMKQRIATLTNENQSLQNMLEKHRVNGIKLQDENDQLRGDIERMRKLEDDIIERCEMFESTDQDLAVALKEMREQEKLEDAQKLEKYSKDVPKLNLEKVQEIIRLKCEEENMESYIEEEEEETSLDEN